MIHHASIVRIAAASAAAYLIMLFGAPAHAVEPCRPSEVFSDVSDCDTPRDGTLSGWQLGLDLGLGTTRTSTENRVGVGPGPAFQLRLGLSFWDQFATELAFGGLQPNDRKPISESVYSCYGVAGGPANCSNDPERVQSIVRTSFVSGAIGYQTRFRPWRGFSLVPAAFLGHTIQVSRFERGISNCVGCRDETVDASASGAFLTPHLRATFGSLGELAACVRSQWFLSGDLEQITTLGFELGFP